MRCEIVKQLDEKAAHFNIYISLKTKHQITSKCSNSPETYCFQCPTVITNWKSYFIRGLHL